MTTEPVDYERLAAQWLRAMRGRRSQRALSKRLGYRTNIAYRWESGRCWPTAAATMRAMKKLGFDLRAALLKFQGATEPWTQTCELDRREGIVELLQRLRQRTPLVAIAAATGKSRFSVARWLKGDAEPRLPELLQLIDACSLRLLDFAAAFFVPEQLPELSARLRQLEAVRRAAYDEPFSHAVLRALELAPYAALRRHSDAWIAARLGITRREAQRCVRVLAEATQVRFDGTHYRVAGQTVVDTRTDPRGAQKAKVYWLRHALDALEHEREGRFVFNLMSLSQADYERLRELTDRYFRELRAIVAESSPNERVALFCAQLLPLDRPSRR